MNQAWRWTPQNEKKARQRLGVSAYRPGQQELIHAVLNGKDALGILPTGCGKSLCYQRWLRLIGQNVLFLQWSLAMSPYAAVSRAGRLSKYTASGV
jgi:hypothetical protein